MIEKTSPTRQVTHDMRMTILHCTSSTIHDITVRHINNTSSISLSDPFAPIQPPSVSLDVSSRCQCIDFIRATATDRSHDTGQSTGVLLAGGGAYRAIGSVSVSVVYAEQPVLGHGGVMAEEMEEDEPKVWTAG